MRSRIIGNDKVDRKRFSSPTYVNGRHTLGTPTLTTDICVTVQSPMSDSLFINTLIQNMEGKRSREVIVVYCDKDTFQEYDDRDNTPADIIVYEGDEYEVQKIDHRKGIQIKHDKVFAVRKES